MSRRGCGSEVRSRDGGSTWLCSRPEDHSGDHVAEAWSRGTRRRPVAVWTDSRFLIEEPRLGEVLEAVEAARKEP